MGDVPCSGVAEPSHDTTASLPFRATSSAQHHWWWHLARTERTLRPEVVLPRGAFAFRYFLVYVKVFDSLSVAW